MILRCSHNECFVLAKLTVYTDATYMYRCRFISSFGNNTITIDVNGTDTMCDVKYSVEQKLGIPSDSQKFRFGGRQLIDNCSLTDQKIYQESTLQLLLHLRGGMQKFRSIPTCATIFTTSSMLSPIFLLLLLFWAGSCFGFFCLVFLQSNLMKTIPQIFPRRFCQQNICKRRLNSGSFEKV